MQNLEINLEIIAQSMLINDEDFVEVPEVLEPILLGRFYENEKQVVYLCKDNDSCNMSNWIKIQRII